MVTVSPYARKLVTNRAEAQMLSQIQILRGELGQLDEATGKVGGITGATVIYTGKARITKVNGPGTLSVGQGVIATRSTAISYPISAPVARVDDLVKVLDDNLSDDDLDNRFFRVIDADGGGYIGATRRLTCVSFYESRYWGEQ